MKREHLLMSIENIKKTVEISISQTIALETTCEGLDKEAIKLEEITGLLTDAYLKLCEIK